MDCQSLDQRCRISDCRPAAMAGAWPKKRLAGASFEETLVSQTDDGIRIEPLYERDADGDPPMPRKIPKSPWIVSPAHRRSGSRARQRRRRRRMWRRAQRDCRWSSKARRTHSATACRERPQALETVLDGMPLNRIHLRIDAHPCEPRHGRLAGRAF